MNADSEARLKIGNPDVKQEPLLSDELKQQIVDKLGHRWIVPSEHVARIRKDGIKLGDSIREVNLWVEINDMAIAQRPKRKRITFGELAHAVNLWEDLGIYPERVEKTS